VSKPNKQQSPADAIAACEADIDRLKRGLEAQAARAIELAEQRKAARLRCARAARSREPQAA
jgi:hypothetical protein